MPDARSKAEERLLTFVRVVAFLERMGNALGRLVLIWATVVVGFSKDLGYHLWFLAGFVIFESFRAFSRESKSDDQLLFKTTGAIKLKRVSLPIGSLYYVNAIAIALFLFGSVAYILPIYSGFISSTAFLPLVMVLSRVNKTRFPKFIEKMSMPGSSCWLRFMPAGALILATAIQGFFGGDLFGAFGLLFGSAAVLQWFVFNCIARAQSPAAFPCLQRLKYLRAILVTGIVVALLAAFQFVAFVTMVAPLVLGNLQIPVSMTRIMLALSVLVVDDFDLNVPDNKAHLVQVLKAFYVMVLCQGILYILACILESFSYFPRTSLAQRCGLVDKVGLESISLYYEQAYDMFVQESLLDAKDMSLVAFAVDSLNSKVSHEKKLAAVRILHSFLQQRHQRQQVGQIGQDGQASNTKVVSEIIGSTKAVTTLISMLGSVVPEDADIRLFTAKVVADLAQYLRISGIPGTMQMVSSLLDSGNKPGREDSSPQIANAADQEVREASGSLGVEGNEGNAADQEIGHAPNSPTMDPEQGNAGNQVITHRSSSATVNGNGGNVVDQQIRQSPSYSTFNVENDDNQSRIQDYPIQAARRWSRMCKIYQDMKKLWSIRYDSLQGEDSFPVLGLLILGSFSDDVDNCAEISRATEVLPKIIGLIRNITSTTTPQQKKVTTSALVLVAKLASVEWKSGVTLRKELSENPFLLSKLAEIVANNCSGPEQWKPTMDIIAKLAMNEETRQEIGGIQVIISKLMHVFLGRDEPSNRYDPSLRTAAGQALAMLAMESAGNCSAILDEPVYNTILDLNQMLIDYENEYHVVTILQSLWAHSRVEPHHRSRLNNQMLPDIIAEVLGRIMSAEGKRMEALVGLASQICNVVPELFIHGLESNLGAAAFVQELVYKLNACTRPTAEFPRMRRSLVELTVSMAQSCDRYPAIFKEHGMVEALLKVEKTPSRVEKYRLFYGSVGVVPEGLGTLSNLVATAKGLIIM